MKKRYKILITLFVLLIQIPLIAQEKQNVVFKKDNNKVCSSEEAKVIVYSNSDELTITDPTTGRIAEKTSNNDGTYQYAINIFYDGVEENYVKTNLQLRSSDGQQTLPVVAYVGITVTGTYNIETMVVVKDDSAVRSYPEERKAKITFLSALDDLTIQCNGHTLFENGNAAKSSTNILSKISKTENLSEYELIFSLDGGQEKNFLKDNLKFTISSSIGNVQIQQATLGVKESHQYVVKSNVKIVEKEISYTDLLNEANLLAGDIASQTASIVFLKVADAYEAAAKHIDCPLEKKDTHQLEANRFKKARRSADIVEKVDKLKGKHEPSSQDYWKCLSLQRKELAKIIEEFPDNKHYQALYSQIDADYSNHPLSKIEYPVISGTVTKGDGWFLPVEGTRIYALDFYASELSDVKNLQPVGAVQNGRYSITLRKKCDYLYFHGEKKSHPIEYTTQTLDIELTR